ncbi:MAG: succinate dehydrogenase iron-sulfur subunit [bacterium]
MKRVVLKIRRQDAPSKPVRWETFTIPYTRGMNVISALLHIRENPVTAGGKPTTPVAWDCNCLEEVCGACTMLINRRVRQACSALIDQLHQPITLEPMSKFPLVRDLVVDRSKMFETLKKIKAWIPIDGTYALGAGPRFSISEQQIGYPLSRCMTCGCCMEACPQVNPRSNFIGAFSIAQARLFNLHPTGRLNAHERLEALVGIGGATDCGNAQNCEPVCPKQIPLIASIAQVNRAITIHSIFSLFSR